MEPILKHERCEDDQDRKILSLHSFTIDGKTFFLPTGFYLVKDLKQLAGIQPCHILAEIRGTNVDDLTDDTATHIKGCEIFKSYPGKGENS